MSRPRKTGPKNLFCSHFQTITMQHTTITFLPTPVPDIAFFSRDAAGEVDKTYPIAAYSGGLLEFEHKITLAAGGQIAQIMSKDPVTGLFSIALPEDAFSIADEFLGISLSELNTAQGGTSFTARLFKNESTQDPGASGAASQVLLRNIANNAPQIAFAEIVDEAGSATGSTLSFIGATDVRTGFTAPRVIIRPGETVYLKANANNDLILQF